MTFGLIKIVTITFLVCSFRTTGHFDVDALFLTDNENVKI